MRKIVSMGLRLFIIAVVAALLLGVTYGVTKEPIAQQQQMQSDASNRSVLAAAQSFEQIPSQTLQAQAGYQDFDGVSGVFLGKADGQTVGYVVKLVSKGYGGDISMTVGIDVTGAYSGVAIDELSETAGLGANATKPEWLAQFTGKPSDAQLVVSKQAGDGEIQALTGATITSRAVATGVDTAGEFYREVLMPMQEGV